MANERLILAIGRIENALSRLEQYNPGESSGDADSDLVQRHEHLKSEARAAITAIDSILVEKGS